MSDDVTSATWGRKAPPHGETPAVALIDPKYPHNVGMVVRLASCYGLRQVWFTGDRVSLHLADPDRLAEAQSLAERIGGGTLLRTQGDRVDLSLPDAAGVLGELLDRLAGAGVALIGLEVHPPTLDDVFLSLTGRELRDRPIAA